MLLQILLHSSKLSLCAPKALRKDCSQAFREASAPPDVSNYKITIQLFSWKSCKHVWCLAGCASHFSFFCVDDGENFFAPSCSAFQLFAIFCSGNINRSSVARWTGGDGEARIHSRAFCEFYELKVLYCLSGGKRVSRRKKAFISEWRGSFKGLEVSVMSQPLPHSSPNECQTS